MHPDIHCFVIERFWDSCFILFHFTVMPSGSNPLFPETPARISECVPPECPGSAVRVFLFVDLLQGAFRGIFQRVLSLPEIEHPEFRNHRRVTRFFRLHDHIVSSKSAFPVGTQGVLSGLIVSSYDWPAGSSGPAAAESALYFSSCMMGHHSLNAL